LLAEVARQEARQKRGKLKVFFGMSAGVGKTYAMLEEARARAAEGLDVVVGYAEQHIRPDTEALLLGLVGTDGNTGGTRFTLGITELTDGIDIATLAIGIFGIGEIITNLTRPQETRALAAKKITRLWPTHDDFRRASPAVLRGTALGSILGVLPGGGATLSAFAAYALEKRWSRNPAQFGHGAVEGVAGPESANNAGAQTSFIPLLTLGIPENAVMAMMVGAMTIHNIQPGPQVMTNNPSLFWGLIASMWIGNLMLVVLNLPMIGIWIKLLTVPYRMLYPAILLFCAIGVYTVNNTSFDVMQTAFERAWHHRGRYDPQRSLRNWLLAIAGHEAISTARPPRARRHRRIVAVGPGGDLVADGRRQRRQHL